MAGSRSLAVLVAVVGPLVAIEAFPSVAWAHGPLAPIAASYLARVAQHPVGVDAKVVDGDQRLWLGVSSTDRGGARHRGAPYLRFSSSGVAVNQNSAMYYFNQTPAVVPPSNLGVNAPPKWSRAGGGHDYSWHDGRLHALATVAIAPGTAYVGQWSIPVRINGAPSVIAGGVWHADHPSIVWFWPIAVLIACTLAARRVGRPDLDAGVARLLAVGAMAGITVAGVGVELHGRPAVSVVQLVTLAIIVAFVVWAARELLLGRASYFTFFAVGFVATWEGANLIPTLVDGFVLAAVPASVARVACVACLGCAGALLLISSGLIGESEPDDGENDDYDDEDAVLWESRA